MPDHRLERFGMRRYRFGINGRYNRYGIADFRRVTSITANDPEHLRSDLFGILQCMNQIGTDILLKVAAANGKDEDRVGRPETARLQPFNKHRFPAFIIGPRGEFGNIVGRRIRLHADDLAEIVNRVAAIAGAASDPKKKQPSAVVSQRSKY